MPRPKIHHLKRRKDGRYCATFDGRQFMGYTEREAYAKRDEYKRQKAAGEYIKENPTVRQYADKWLPLHKNGVSEKCYDDYKKQLDALCSVIGDEYLRTITVDDAAAVWLHYSGYSASTIHRARMLYIAMFDTAVENDIISKNPFRGTHAQPPAGYSGTHRALTDEEINLIWSTPHRMQLAALVMLYCGLRRGEVLALTDADIDTSSNVLIVNKAIRFDGNKPVVVAPKTASGVRVVPIPTNIRPYFDSFTGRILSAKNGGIMTETGFSRCWESFVLHLSRNAGRPVNIRPHDLRHTYCTILADSGVSIKQALVWMGHADEKMILHVYDHITDRRTQESLDLVEKHLLSMQKTMQHD